MPCSRCSEQVLPVVAIDIDGTLGNYHLHFRNFAVQYLDAEYAPASVGPRGDEPYREWFCRAFDVDVTTFREIKLAYRQGAQKRTMPIFRGARELMANLAAAPVEVWLTTTRPYLKLDGIDRDTREWLRRNKIAYDKLLYDEDKYQVLCESVGRDRVAAVLDDEVEQVQRAAELFGRSVPILRALPGTIAVNLDQTSYCNDLVQASGMVLDRVQSWMRVSASVSA